MVSKRFIFFLIFTIPFAFIWGGNTDMRFIENKGQWDKDIKFSSPLNFGNIYFENNQFTFVLLEGEHSHSSTEKTIHQEDLKGHHYKIIFEGANPKPYFTYSGKSEHYYNYFLGNDSNKWQNFVYDYASITYRNLYNGIDMHAIGEGDNFKYEYYVAPNSNPNQIQVRYDGIEKLNLRDGNLVYSTSVSNVKELAPYAYQWIDGKKKEVVCNYKIKDLTVSFKFPKGYDKKVELIIDPTLIFARLSESTSDNFGFTATYDEDGRAYAGGIVFGASGSYPTTTGSFSQNFFGGSASVNGTRPVDIGISCYNETSGNLIYGTYIGGNSNELPNSMIVNNQGELVVLATSGSPDFPASNNAFDTNFEGGSPVNLITNGIYFPQGSDIVVFKLSNNGSNLLSSTYLGGNENDGLNDDNSYQEEYEETDLHFNYGDAFRGEVIIDDNDNIYIASSTNSDDFPTQGSTSNLRGEQDAVVVKFSPNLSNLIFSRYLGGNDDDAGYSMKIDNDANLFVVGGTKSFDFPVVGNPLNGNYQGGASDGFISKLNSNNGSVLAATFIGTSSYDQVYFVDLDEGDNAYIVGQTLGNYPVTSAIYSETQGKQFIHKLDNNLSTTIYSTKFGTGSARVDISPTALLVDVCERVYVSGWGGSTNTNRNPDETNTNIFGLATTPDAIASQPFGGDFYFFVLDKNATGLLYASYFGGSANEHVDGGTSRFDDQGVIYQAICAACGGPTTFPSTPGFNNNSSSPNCNVGLVKLDIGLPITNVEIDAFPTATGCVPLTVNFQSILNDVETFSWDLGDGTTSTLQNPINTYTDTGAYTITLIGADPNSCNENDTAFISVFVSDDTIAVDKIDTLYFDCNTYEIYVAAPFDPSASYSWDMGDGTILSDFSNEVNYAYADGGVFDIVLTIVDSTKCDNIGYDTVILDFPPFIYADIGTNFGCINTPLSMVNFGNPEAENIFWNLGNGETSTEFQPTTTYLDGGDYTVFLTMIDSGTCNIISADTNIISIIPPTIANFVTDSNYYIYPDLVQFTNLSINFDSFIWNFGDTKLDSTTLDPLHFYETIFEFTPCLITSNQGCKDTICRDIFIDFIPLIGIPNAFSPNGDGINDLIKVEGVGITNLNFKIYNRWGELVYEGFDQEEGWDGSFKGQEQEMEVYTYIVSAIFLDDSQQILKGNLTLLR